jgi:hypothetical protein
MQCGKRVTHEHVGAAGGNQFHVLLLIPAAAINMKPDGSLDVRAGRSYGAGSGVPADTGGPPPCILSALIVTTMTTALGTRPLVLHLMLKNFSMPMSAPKPASVTTKPSRPTWG